MTNNELMNILVEYIESNKRDYNIQYADTLESLQEMLNTIKRDYEEM